LKKGREELDIMIQKDAANKDRYEQWQAAKQKWVDDKKQRDADRKQKKDSDPDAADPDNADDVMPDSVAKFDAHVDAIAALEASEEEPKYSELEEADKKARLEKWVDARAKRKSELERLLRIADEKAKTLEGMTDAQKEEKAASEKKARAARMETKLVASLNKQLIEYVICCDTLGTGARFTEAQIAQVQQYGKQLRDTLRRIDYAVFGDECNRRDRLAAFNKEQAEKAKSEEDEKAELEELKDELSKESEKKDGAEKGGMLAAGGKLDDTDLKFIHRQRIVYGLKQMIAEFRSYHVFRGPIQVLQCLFYMLDYKQDDVANAKNVADWNKMRTRVDEKLFSRIQAYDPRTEQTRSHSNRYARIKALQALLKDNKYEDIKAQNYPLAEIFAYVKAALDVKKHARNERKRLEREAAEAKQKAADEERKKKEEDDKRQNDQKTAGAGDDGGD